MRSPAANLLVRNLVYPVCGVFGLRGQKMKIVAATVAALAFSSAATTPVRAGDGGGVAAGLIGGLAAGTIIGAAVAGPRYYAPPPPPVYAAPACYWTQGQPVWDPYRGVWTYPPVRVCE